VIRTLVVDDDHRVARLHAACVNRVGGFACVGEVHTAAQARIAIERLQPDLVLLDVFLPDEDGLEVLRFLNGGTGSRPDCIMISAARDLETRRSAIELGAVSYLTKPFGVTQLFAQLEAYRGSSQHTDAATP
jgi:response regulator of citrate/malate metabolism